MVEGARLEIAYPVLSRIVGSNPTDSASKTMFQPSIDEAELRSRILGSVLEYVRENKPIPMSSGIESEFRGRLGDYLYQFEGEEDLLHLWVSKSSGEDVSPNEGRKVFAWVVGDLPEPLVWLKPGQKSQHFYFAQDDLLRS